MPIGTLESYLPRGQRRSRRYLCERRGTARSSYTPCFWRFGDDDVAITVTSMRNRPLRFGDLTLDIYANAERFDSEALPILAQ